MPTVLTVVLNWNQPDTTARCLDCVLAQSHQPNRVLVVDNGSTDDSVSNIAQRFPSVRLISLNTNLGFAEGMNVGLRVGLEERFDFVWMLNNDAFPESSCLKLLVDALQADPGTAMVGPRLFWDDGREQPAGAVAEWPSGAFAVRTAAELLTEVGHDHWLMGAACLVRTSTLEAVGLFESSFFAYMEDADLGVRIGKTGRVRPVEEAVATHIGGATSGGYASAFCQFLMIRNCWLFLSRNAPPGSQWARWCRFTAHALRVAEIYEAKGLDAVRLAVLAGVTAARRRQFGAPGSLTECGAQERFLARHPNRASQWLDTLAGGLERAWSLTHG